MVDFGNRLKELRKQYNLTQKQLADKLGITKSVVSYYELSERCPSPEILVKLAEIFNTTTDYLLNIERTRVIDVSELTDDEIEVINSMVSILKNKQLKRR